MNEENQNQEIPEVEVQETEIVTPVETVNTEVIVPSKTKRNYIIGAVVIVVLIFVALVYFMEKNGQIQTGLFDGMEQARMERTAIAEVNGQKISEYDLTISMEQISAGASAQGVDVTDPDTKQSIKEQAIEMLINTELLRQEAAARGIEVTNGDVDARYEQLVGEVGGEDVLAERMAQFGVTRAILLRDIRNELTIQQLLDQVFESADLTVSDEEIQELYDSAGGVAAGLPALEEVKAQIQQQIETTKEQEVVNSFVEELRTKATIDIKIEV